MKKRPCRWVVHPTRRNLAAALGLAQRGEKPLRRLQWHRQTMASTSHAVQGQLAVS